MIHNKFRYILTLVALFAMTAGAWAEETVFEYADPMVGTLTQGTGTSATTVTINSESVNAIKFGNTYKYADGKYITIAPSSGSFKKGDVVSIAGCISNGNAESNAKAGIYTADGATQLYETANVVNAQLSTDAPVVETYTLTQDAEKLLIARSTGTTALYITTLKVVRTASAPAGPEVTWDKTTKQATFTMPAGNVELQVEYWPGMLVKPTNLVGGTLSVEGLGLGTTSFTAPSEWDHNSTKLTSGHFEGFKSVTEEEAKTWPGVPATGKVALFYNYDETEQKWDMIYFKDGAISQNFKGEPQQLATIYNLTDFSFSVFYTTGMQMPAGFEKDDEGNIYVKKDTKFTVIATPAEGYHLVSWSDDATIKELEREFTMTDDDFTVTATFSDEYDLAFEAANANTIEAGKATVKVGDDAATVTEGKLQGVKMGSKVTITAKQGYKFRKVEAKKGGAATLATALENGATVVIAFKYRDDGTCTFTNNNGTFTFVSGTGQLGGGNGPKQLSVENGKLIFKGSGTNSFTDRWSWYGFQVTFDPTANTYEVWKGSYLDVGSFTSISVNGTDITDQLSELK